MRYVLNMYTSREEFLEGSVTRRTTSRVGGNALSEYVDECKLGRQINDFIQTYEDFDPKDRPLELIVTIDVEE